MSRPRCFVLLATLSVAASTAFMQKSLPSKIISRPVPASAPNNKVLASRANEKNNDLSSVALHMAGGDSMDDNKFSFAQRIESIKCVVVGAIGGGLALTPFTALHDIIIGRGGLVQNGVAQWEFDTDMGALQAALFAIVYRYCVREDTNPMLNQGIVGAFVLVRTLSRVSVPTYCTAAPLDCGAPLGYFDWDMITQAGLNGIESAALFGAAAVAMEYCFSRKIISKFP